MEVTVSGTVLVGQVHIQTASLHAQTTGNTMRILPVDVVSRGGLRDTRRVESRVAIASILVWR